MEYISAEWNNINNNGCRALGGFLFWAYPRNSSR